MTSILASIQVKATVTLQVMFETLLHVLPVPGGDKEWYLYAARAGLPNGVVSHRSYVSLTRSPVAKAPTTRPAPPPFSSIMARRRRWLAARKIGPQVSGVSVG